MRDTPSRGRHAARREQGHPALRAAMLMIGVVALLVALSVLSALG